jgi:hypothetical protein
VHSKIPAPAVVLHHGVWTKATVRTTLKGTVFIEFSVTIRNIPQPVFRHRLFSKVPSTSTKDRSRAFHDVLSPLVNGNYVSEFWVECGRICSKEEIHYLYGELIFGRQIR